MGLFDTVVVSNDVSASFDLKCSGCGRLAPPGTQWQTKSLDACMFSYFLRVHEDGHVRLFLLDRPSDKRFWRPWTTEEIEESERSAARGGIASSWRKSPGEGTFLPEAHLPENRRQRFMGELPHQWVEIWRSCACGEAVVYWLKFCDGIATEARRELPRQESGFFDDASGFGL